MMNSERTAETVARIATNAAQNLATVHGRITDQFAAGVIVSAGSLEALISAQAEANITAQVQTRWNRGGAAAIESWLEDAAVRLIEDNAGGSSSQVQNQVEAADRKALQAAYRALSRCRD